MYVSLSGHKELITTQDRVKSLVIATLNDPHVTESGVYVPYVFTH